jgi:hypothetical protein
VPAGQGHVLTVAATEHYNFTNQGVYFDLVDSAFLGSTVRARCVSPAAICEPSSAPTCWAGPISLWRARLPAIPRFMRSRFEAIAALLTTNAPNDLTSPG